MSLYLIWRGSDSIILYERLAIIAKFTQGIASDINIGLERLLDEYIQTIFLSNSAVCKIDGHLYWTKNLKEFHLSIPIMFEGNNIFPSIVLGEVTNDVLESLYNTIATEIQESTATEVKYRLDKSFIQHSLNLYIETDIDLLENFERTRLGIFIYLLYLTKTYSGSCILVSDLYPLFKKCLQIEADMLSMSKKDFLVKYSFYSKNYDNFKISYKTERIFNFRTRILFTMLSQLGPFVTSEISINKIKANVPNSFKSLFNKCKEGAHRFSIGFSVLSREAGAHGTVLIIDNKEKVIERFDPNGYIKTIDEVQEQMDYQLTLFAKENGYIYASPDTFCPRIGIQQIEHLFSSNIGYCVSWSIIYAEERISSSYDRKYVAENLLDIVMTKYKIKGATMQEKANNLQIWMDNRIKDIFKGMDNAFNELSAYLEIPVSYIDNKLKYSLL